MQILNKCMSTTKLYPAFFVIFNINMTSLKSERVDSTETTIS